jgi:hypothetical protein
MLTLLARKEDLIMYNILASLEGKTLNAHRLTKAGNFSSNGL